MSALQQYIDLYRDNSEAVCAPSSEPQNRLRRDALELLGASSLPDRHTHSYEKTSVEEMFAPDYGVNILRRDIPLQAVSGFRCDVPRVSTMLAYVVNDAFVPSETLKARLPEGVVVGSLAKSAAHHPDVVERWLGKVAPASNPCVALNNLLEQDGVLIYIPDGMRLEKPIQIVNMFSSTIPMLAFRRLLVVLGRDASAQILICNHTATPTLSFLSSEVTEVSLGSGATLDFCMMEESSATTACHSMLYARQEAGSRLNVAGITLSCGQTRNDFHVEHVGEECSTTLSGMAIGAESRHIDNSTQVIHRQPRCTSRQLFKYILDDESTGAFEGDITVLHGAVGTSAYQSNKNLLASTKAKMHTQPQLLIYCDDVKCSHGASTGQLDQDALFYMRSRGIDEKTARNMLMQAFMSEVIDNISIEGMRDRLRHLVEKHLHGQSAYCAECSLTSNQPSAAENDPA